MVLNTNGRTADLRSTIEKRKVESQRNLTTGLVPARLLLSVVAGPGSRGCRVS